MEKLRLDLSELEVESFSTTPPNDASRGTVYGYTAAQPCQTLPGDTEGCGCIETEYGSCLHTGCGNTCGGTCFGTCEGETCPVDTCEGCWTEGPETECGSCECETTFCTHDPECTQQAGCTLDCDR